MHIHQHLFMNVFISGNKMKQKSILSEEEKEEIYDDINNNDNFVLRVVTRYEKRLIEVVILETEKAIIEKLTKKIDKVISSSTNKVLKHYLFQEKCQQ